MSLTIAFLHPSLSVLMLPTHCRPRNPRFLHLISHDSKDLARCQTRLKSRLSAIEYGLRRSGASEESSRSANDHRTHLRHDRGSSPFTRGPLKKPWRGTDLPRATGEVDDNGAEGGLLSRVDHRPLQRDHRPSTRAKLEGNYAERRHPNEVSCEYSAVLRMRRP